MQLQENRPHRVTINAKTGHHAPSSGWWRPENEPAPVRYLQQGEIMPALRGSQTVWTLLREIAPAPEAGFPSTYS